MEYHVKFDSNKRCINLDVVQEIKDNLKKGDVVIYSGPKMKTFRCEYTAEDYLGRPIGVCDL